MTVNVENINLMIEAISKQANPIRMDDFVTRNTECGTTACLAGWANILRLKQEGKGRSWQLDDSEGAAEWMGLEPAQGMRLFFSFGADQLDPETSKAKTIALLTRLRDTGDARWCDVL